MSNPRELRDAHARKLVEGIRIPPQPELLQKVNQLIGSGDPNLGEIAAIISADVGLSAAMLKTINSPFFGLRRKISSIHHATLLLGLKNVVNLLTGFALRSAMQQSGMRLDHFWDAASDTALACTVVARELHICAPDEAYTLGLFRDCGLPLMMQRFPNYIAVLKAGNSTLGKTLAEVEDEQLGTNHAVVAYYVAKSWRLPEHLTRAILEHHNLRHIDSAEGDVAALVAVINLGEQLVHHHRRASDNFEWELMRERVMEVLCIGEADYQDLLEAVGLTLAA